MCVSIFSVSVLFSVGRHLVMNGSTTRRVLVCVYVTWLLKLSCPGTGRARRYKM